MTFLRSILLLPGVCAVLACSDNEAPPADDHVPESYTMLVNGFEVTSPFTFRSGETVRVRLKFFNAAEEDLDEVESTHYAALTFQPAELATAVRLGDPHYQFDVTGGPAGSGTVQVSYGHDEAADEHEFDPEPVTVSAGGGGGGELSQ